MAVWLMVTLWESEGDGLLIQTKSRFETLFESEASLSFQGLSQVICFCL